MDVFYVSTEATPFLMVGDLANATFQMAKASQELGVKTSIIMPLYKAIKEKEKLNFLGNSFVNIGSYQKYLGVFTKDYQDITYYFIDNEEYFYHDTIYGHGNDGERFTYFAEAVLEALRLLKHYPDILHLHDWPTGLIPYLLKSKYKYHVEYQKIKTFFTIYDVSYQQGIFPMPMEDIIDAVNSPILYLDNKINFTKAAISEADFISCSSKSYHDDLLKANNSLALYLNDNKKHFKGILLGIDKKTFNPEIDKALYQNYNDTNFIKKRYLNKEKFKQDNNFNNTNCILVSIVGANISDKAKKTSIDTACYLLDTTDAEVYMMFKTTQEDLITLNELEHKYPGRFKYLHEYDYKMATLVFAASDIVIHPYYNSPSTSTQMISMNYGAVIITNESGSVRDIIKPYNQYTGEGNCFSFVNPNHEDFAKVFDLAYGLYRFNQNEWFKVVRNAMKENFNTLNYTQEIIEIYKKLIGN